MEGEGRLAGLKDRIRSRPVFWSGVLLFVVYLVVPNPGLVGGHRHIDAVTNAITAWHLGVRGSVVVPDMADALGSEFRQELHWFKESKHGPASQYPPGTAIYGAPFYALLGREAPLELVRAADDPSIVASMPYTEHFPARLAGALAVAVGLTLVAVAAHRSGASAPAAVTALLVAGLTTPFWTVAASDLWTHGAGVLTVAVGVFAASSGRWVLSGLGFALAALVRPHLLVISAVIGVATSVKERRIRPAVELGLASSLGLVALLSYNRWLWGEWSISGGYGSVFADNLQTADLAAWGENILGALFDPTVGLFILTPVLLVGVITTVAVRAGVETWKWAAALGGVLYLAIQYKANRYSGGDGFLGYRYPLEGSAVTLPLLVGTIDAAWMRSRGWRLAIVGALLLGVLYFGWLAVEFRKAIS